MNNYKIEISNVDCQGCIGLIKIAFEDIEKDAKDFEVNEVSFNQHYAKAQFNSSLDQTSIINILSSLFETELNKYSFKFI